MQAIGLGTSLIGGWLGANAAEDRQKELRQLAERPGLKLGDIYNDSLSSGMNALPAAGGLAGGANALALADINSLYETSIPGFAESRKQRAGNNLSFLRGEIPDDVASSIFRSGNARATEGGYAGSPMGRNLVARDLGLTSLDLMQRGATDSDSMTRGTPMPRIKQASDLLIGPQATLGLRTGERNKFLDMMTGAVESPGAEDVWARILQDVGGDMAGGGQTGQGSLGWLLNWGIGMGIGG